MIKPSLKMEKKIRELVEESYAQAIDGIGQEEFFYIGRHIDKKLAGVRRSGTKWVRDMALHCDALHQMYLDYTEGVLQLSNRQVAAIGAALFYFVNPYDIIPDHIPGRGYLDDAHVINLCVEELDSGAPRLFLGYLNAAKKTSKDAVE
jgi:uncharacterized membrane protein YkvA (DUF1232 family)